MKNKVKSFFEEFKKFITRGNVLDMAVGVIVGGAFTGIVNALSNHILKPIINALLALVLGSEGLEGAITMLSPAYFADNPGVVDLANSIYIDWGAFISAIINFFLIAFVLFTIVKAMNRVKEANEKMKVEYETERAAVKKYRKEGLKKKQAVEKYRNDLKLAEERAAQEKKAAEEEAARVAAEEKKKQEEKELANTRLLEEIRDLLKNK